MFANRISRNLCIAAFAGLTVGAMTLFFALYEPWQPAGPEIIPDGGFSTPAATNGWAGWSPLARIVPDGGFNGSPGVVLTTTASNRHGVLRFFVTEIAGRKAFRVSLRAATSDVRGGAEPWQVPRSLFCYYDQNKKGLYHIRHQIFSAEKQQPWRSYAAFFPVPEEAVEARFYLQNLGRDGVLRVDDVSVIPVRPRSSAPWWKAFFGLLWFAAAGLSAAALSLWKRRFGPLICATVVLILIGVLLPGELLDGGIEQTKQGIQMLSKKFSPPKPAAASAGQPAAPQPAAPKEEKPPLFTGAEALDHAHLIGHFALFSLLALLCALSWFSEKPSLRRAAAVFAGLTLFAAATEALQFVTIDRIASLYDLRTDLAGMAIVILLVFAAARLRRTVFASKNKQVTAP